MDEWEFSLPRNPSTASTSGNASSLGALFRSQEDPAAAAASAAAPAAPASAAAPAPAPEASSGKLGAASQVEHQGGDDGMNFEMQPTKIELVCSFLFDWGRRRGEGGKNEMRILNELL